MNIKDYLHLYLGCECSWEHPEGNCGGRTEMDVHTLELFNDENYKVKPILRPLSDMTDEESIESERISNGDDVGYYFAEKTKYLLSKHFDLFGLIEAGLAIDKTKITANGIS